jgi:hypothetical protein
MTVHSARLIDFPESGSDPEALTRWVSNYFFPPTPTGAANAHSILSGAAPVIQTEKMPLILQVSFTEAASWK